MTSASAEVLDQEDSLLQPFCKAVSDDLTLLAVLNGNELSEDLLSQLKTIDYPLHLGVKLKGIKIKPALTTLNRAVRNLPDTLKADKKNILDMDFAGIYLNHAYRASPEESVWIDEENLAMQQPMFQVRKYYQRYGLEVENWRVRPDDHLVTQIQFIAYLLSIDNSIDTLRIIARFLDEHLLRWVVSFAERAAMHCETPFYASLVIVTAFYLEEFRDLLAEILDQARPDPNEVERRMKPVTETTIEPMKYVPGSAESW